MRLGMSAFTQILTQHLTWHCASYLWPEHTSWALNLKRSCKLSQKTPGCLQCLVVTSTNSLWVQLCTYIPTLQTDMTAVKILVIFLPMNVSEINESLFTLLQLLKRKEWLLNISLQHTNTNWHHLHNLWNISLNLLKNGKFLIKLVFIEWLLFSASLSCKPYSYRKSPSFCAANETLLLYVL